MRSHEETKKLLYQYRDVQQLIDDLEQQIQYVDDKAKRIRSSDYSGMPRGGTPITMADLVADKHDLERRKQRLEKIADQKKEIVQSYIDTVFSVKHNKFLTLYFVKCLSVYEISKRMDCTKRHAFRIYSEALEMVDLSLDL